MIKFIKNNRCINQHLTLNCISGYLYNSTIKLTKRRKIIREEQITNSRRNDTFKTSFPSADQNLHH